MGDLWTGSTIEDGGGRGGGLLTIVDEGMAVSRGVEEEGCGSVCGGRGQGTSGPWSLELG